MDRSRTCIGEGNSFGRLVSVLLVKAAVTVALLGHLNADLVLLRC